MTEEANYYEIILELKQLQENIRKEPNHFEMIRTKLLKCIFDYDILRDTFTSKITEFLQKFKTTKFKRHANTIYNKYKKILQQHKPLIDDFEARTDKKEIFYYPSSLIIIQKSEEIEIDYDDIEPVLKVEAGIIDFYSQISPDIEELLFFDKNFDYSNIDFYVTYNNIQLSENSSNFKRYFVSSCLSGVIQALIFYLESEAKRKYFNLLTSEDSINIKRALQEKNLIELAKAIQNATNQDKKEHLLDLQIQYGTNKLLDTQDKLRHCVDLICEIFAPGQKPKSYNQARKYLKDFDNLEA